MDADMIASRIEASLRAAGTPERAVKERAYLKSDLQFLGASVPVIRSTTVAVRRESDDPDHGTVVATVEALWGRAIHECQHGGRGAAVARSGAHDTR